MKRNATLLLIAASVLFVITRYFESRYPWLGIVRATMEAAMVGGIADWFAVTALFRHPLGIPIPHTAIVPAKKDRVGRTLGAFVQRNFLSRDVIEHRMASMRWGRRLAEWLADPINARTISKTTAGAMSSAAHMLRDEDVEEVIDRTVGARRADDERRAPSSAKSCASSPRTTAIRKCSTRCCASRRARSTTTPMSFASVSSAKRRGGSRPRSKTRSSSACSAAFEVVIGAERRPAASIARKSSTASLDKFIERLNTSPEFAAKVEAWKEEFLDNEAARKFSSSLWQEGKEALAKFAEHPGDAAPNAIEKALTTFGQKALEDPELLAKLDEFAIDVAAISCNGIRTKSPI